MYAPQIEELDKYDKEYEYINLQFDPFLPIIKNSLDTIKQFIRDRGLIIYGGSAIDYALRLRGERLYSDEFPPLTDLDVYSKNAANDAYDLVIILGRIGLKTARTIKGIHTETMRVDLGDNHFIVDISYMSPNIFDLVDTLEYEGMRIIHPHIQFADLRRALFIPFENPPIEAIFNRKKDIKRYDILRAAYPLTYIRDNAAKQSSNKIKWPAARSILFNKDRGKFVFCGLCGFILLCESYKKIAAKISALAKVNEKAAEIEDILAALPPYSAKESPEGGIIFDMPTNIVDIIGPSAALRDLGDPEAAECYSESNFSPPFAAFKIDECVVRFYDTNNTYIGVSVLEGTAAASIFCIQRQLVIERFSLGLSYSIEADVLMCMYELLDRMIDSLVFLPMTEGGISLASPFTFPRIMYGEENRSEIFLLNIGRVPGKEKKEAAKLYPKNYTFEDTATPPTFDYSNFEYNGLIKNKAANGEQKNKEE